MSVSAEFHHIAVAVRDMDRMLAFYNGLLDFQIEWDKPHYTGESFSKVVALDDAAARVVMLSGHGAHIELFQYFHPQGRDLGDMRMCDFGFTHFALSVNGIDELHEKLEAAGTRFNSPPLDLRPGVRAAYLRDPEGNTIELVQYTTA